MEKKQKRFEVNNFRVKTYYVDGSVVCFQIGLINHFVKQNSNGDAAYVRALELAQEIVPNGPIGVKMAKTAINKGTQVRFFYNLYYN
jgi:hypothetical protein